MLACTEARRGVHGADCVVGRHLPLLLRELDLLLLVLDKGRDLLFVLFVGLQQYFFPLSSLWGVGGLASGRGDDGPGGCGEENAGGDNACGGDALPVGCEEVDQLGWGGTGCEEERIGCRGGCTRRALPAGHRFPARLVHATCSWLCLRAAYESEN